jgi:hypothetical protein
MLFHCRENIQLKNGGLWSRGNIIPRVKVCGEAENLRDEWFIAPLPGSLIASYSLPYTRPMAGTGTSKPKGARKRR